MTNKIKITELEELTNVEAADWVPVVDVDDTTQSPEGTTKKLRKERLKGLNWQGAWVAGDYVADDLVEYNGSAYVAVTNTSGEPTISADWELLVSKGDQGDQGIQGDAGTNGTNGIDGRTILYGAIDPTTEGEDGDFYINTADNMLFGPKAAGVWPAGISLVGPTGPTGPQGPAGPAGPGTGDMLASIYDPQNIAGDAFDTDNHTSGTTNKVYTATEQTKVANITITQAVNLDDIETRVNQLDAAVVLKGIWDASAGTFPGSGTAQAGDSYIVSVGGTVNAVVFNAGDRIIAIIDNASTTVFAANWFKADYTDLFTTQTLGDLINSATSKATPVDADMFALMDSAASNITKKLSWANVKATLKTYIDSMTSTFTNKRMQPRTASSTTASTLTPDLATANIYYRTTQTATLTINAPTGTPVIGETIMIYVDSAGAQTLNINAAYIPFGAAFPATTTAGKTFMMSAQWNGTNWKTLWANAV